MVARLHAIQDSLEQLGRRHGPGDGPGSFGQDREPCIPALEILKIVFHGLQCSLRLEFQILRNIALQQTHREGLTCGSHPMLRADRGDVNQEHQGEDQSECLEPHSRLRLDPCGLDAAALQYGLQTARLPGSIGLPGLAKGCRPQGARGQGGDEEGQGADPMHARNCGDWGQRAVDLPIAHREPWKPREKPPPGSLCQPPCAGQGCRSQDCIAESRGRSRVVGLVSICLATILIVGIIRPTVHAQNPAGQPEGQCRKQSEVACKQHNRKR